MKTYGNVLMGDRFGLLMVMFAAILWGTVGVVVQNIYIQSATNPLSIGFFRLGISVPLLFLTCFGIKRRQMFQIAKRDLALMVLGGIAIAFHKFATLLLLAISEWLLLH
ncbi:MAG: EamA family transporter [Pleurocapsa sp. MO_226.B13]|nr:EamA family transporter [Pleurocapsa sp. MO_226.B13]